VEAPGFCKNELDTFPGLVIYKVTNIGLLVIPVPVPPNNVGEGIMFSGCPSATFFHPDRSCYHVSTISYELLELSRVLQ